MSSLTERAERVERPAERAERVERPVSLSARVTERPRELLEVALMMADGTEVRGMLHRAKRTRTLDFLNFEAEAFVAMTDAILTRGEHTEYVAFIALNKAHVMRVIEAADNE